MNMNHFKPHAIMAAAMCSLLFLFQPAAQAAQGASCVEIINNNPGSADGMYVIDPDGTGPLAERNVYCDMTTNGGGIHMRLIPGSTTVLTEAEAIQLETWLGKGPVTFEPVFSHAPGDGKSSTDFHNAADFITDTVVVAEVTSPAGHKIGGYTGSTHWNQYEANYSPGDGSQFIFNLSTGVKQDAYYNQYAIYSSVDRGPSFGGGHDIYINNTLSSGSTNHHSYDIAPYAYNEPDIIGSSRIHNPVYYGHVEVFKISGLSKALPKPVLPELVAGTGGYGFSGDNGPATSATLAYPYDVATDAAGNLYIVDLHNQRVRRVDATTGVITTVAGNGSRAFSGDGGPATAASLADPVSVDVDAAGNIYIADYGNLRIRRVDANSGIITTVAGTGGVGYNGDNRQATSATLYYPLGVAVDAAGNIFIADYYNQRIRRVDANSGIITTVAGTGGFGYNGDNIQATSATLYYPHGVDVDAAGNLYIADYSNGRIRKVDAATGKISTLVTGVNSFNLSVDATGSVYYNRWSGSSVYRWNSATATSETVATVPMAMGTHVAANGDVYVVSYSSHRVYKLAFGPTNQPPVANAGVDFNAECDSNNGVSFAALNVTLDGSGSSDPDGDTLTYTWSDSALGLLGTGQTLTTGLEAGAHTISLTVDDGNGGTATDTVVITVVDTTSPFAMLAGPDVTLEATGPAGAAYDPVTGAGAGDLCDASLQYSASPAPANYPLGQTLITVRASDDSGNYIEAQKGITVIDTTPPSLVQPADINNVEATSAAGATANFGSPAATDLVDAAPTVTCTPASGSTFGLGTTTVTCTATDASNNGASVSFSVNVVDSTPPGITAPTDLVLEANGNPNSTYTLSIAAAATDAVGIASISSNAPTSWHYGTTVVTWTATDVAGNSATATQNVTFQDTTSPVLTLPANVTAEATGPQTSVAISLATATDIFPVTVSSDAPATFPVGTTTVTWSATDANGNSSSGTQTVTITDITAPSVTPPADITVEASGAATPVVLGVASAIDIVDGMRTASPDQTGPFAPGVHTITWSATDAYGNTGTATQTVTVIDTTPPSVIAPANISMEATGPTTAVALGTATASDLVDGALSATPDQTGPFTPGVHTITWSATDSHGNAGTATQLVTITDTTAPSLNVPANISVEANAVGSSIVTGTASATDLVDGVVAASSDAPATFPLGTTVVTYSATDAHGNTATATQSVTVVDTTPPALSVPADVNIEANAVDSTTAIGTATATDIFGIRSIVSDAPAAFPLGTTVVTWTATDNNGLVTTGTQSVTVADTTPPVLNVPADVSTEATGAQTSVAIGSATATDIFGATASSDAPASFPVGTTVVIWTATDGNGLTTTGTQSVTVVDTMPPAVTAPADVTVEADAIGSTVSIGTASATDLVDGAVAVSSNAPANFPLGLTVVTWTATDAAGNTAMATQNVTVVDTTAPVLTLPADVSVEASAVNSSVAIGTATATDIFAVTVTSDAPATFGMGTTVVTWSATDANGNVSTGTQNVTVVDSTAPVLTVPGDVTEEANGVMSTVTIGTATATDIFAVTVISDAPATYPLGTTVVTWTATDVNGNVTTGTQNVTVVDTTAPAVTATLVPVDLEDDEGKFRVEFTAADIADPNPIVTATLNGATVANGQIVELERDRHAEVENKHGKLEIKGMSFSLNVSANDVSGNRGNAAAAYAFPPEHDDDDDKKHKKDKKDKKNDKKEKKKSNKDKKND